MWSCKTREIKTACEIRGKLMRWGPCQSDSPFFSFQTQSVRLPSCQEKWDQDNPDQGWQRGPGADEVSADKEKISGVANEGKKPTVGWNAGGFQGGSGHTRGAGMGRVRAWLPHIKRASYSLGYCWIFRAGERSFEKRMIFEPSALFSLLCLQEGKLPS